MFKLLLVIAMAAISNLAAADLSGKWTGTMETNSSRVRIFVTLDQHDQQVSGSLATGDEARQVPIENVEVHGNRLTFEAHDNAGRIVSFRLVLTDRLMSGEVNGGGQKSKVTLSHIDFGFFPIAGGLSVPQALPLVLKKVEPQYSEEARLAKYQGTVVLSVEIDPTGSATNIKVVRSLGLGLDEKAVECVKLWKFKPGYKDGTPVTVAATIEVNFRL